MANVYHHSDIVQFYERGTIYIGTIVGIRWSEYWHEYVYDVRVPNYVPITVRACDIRMKVGVGCLEV